jgi:hypothetical protein
MANPEKVYKSPALTQGWENLKAGNLYWFDTVNDYAKKHHLDKKTAPIGWDEEALTVEEAKECCEDDACTAILANKKDKVLVIVKADLPYVLAEGKAQVRIDWEAYAKDGVMAIKRLFKGYALEAVVINPKVKTLEGLGVLKERLSGSPFQLRLRNSRSCRQPFWGPIAHRMGLGVDRFGHGVALIAQ